MSTIDRYLGNVRVGGRASVSVLGVVGVLGFLVLACLLLDAGHDDPASVAARLLGVGWLLVVLVGGLAVLRTGDALDEATQLLVREELSDAIVASQRAISAARDARAKARAFLVLGRCAEIAGDFGEAAQIFGHGLDAHRMRRSAATEDVGDELALRRAFCLAVVARAENVSTTPLPPRSDRRHAIEVLWLRAEVVAQARRRDRAAVQAALVAHAKSRAGAVYRDRVLLSAASLWATAADHDAPPPARVRADERTRAWIERVSPVLAAYVEVIGA